MSKRRWPVLSVVGVIILSACTPSQAITPTRTPTVTPTPFERSSADLSTLATGQAAVLTASAAPGTHTPSPVPATSTPSPTKQRSPATSAPPASPPATAAPAGGSGEPVIETFTASTDQVHPGDIITLTWKTNASAVSIRPILSSGKYDRWYDQPGSGSMDYTVPSTERNPFQMQLVIGPAEKQVYKNLLFSIICPDAWVFDDAPDTCPNPVIQGDWTAERFERGMMVWIGAYGMIYVLRDDGIWSAYLDYWQPGMRESDPNLVPPAGLFQPVRGFGKVWREDFTRDALGWATEPEFATPITLQCDSVYKSAVCILDGPYGRAMLNVWGGGWKYLDAP